MDCLENSLAAIFMHVIPEENTAVHDDIDTHRQQLCRTDATSQVE
jgi:hypothetical protein